MSERADIDKLTEENEGMGLSVDMTAKLLHKYAKAVARADAAEARVKELEAQIADARVTADELAAMVKAAAKAGE